MARKSFEKAKSGPFLAFTSRKNKVDIPLVSLFIIFSQSQLERVNSFIYQNGYETDGLFSETQELSEKSGTKKLPCHIVDAPFCNHYGPRGGCYETENQHSVDMVLPRQRFASESCEDVGRGE